MFCLYADKNNLTVQERERVTSGSVNVCRARFEFSADWEGLEKTAVFRCGGEAVSILLDGSGECTVPWEALRTPGIQLRAGVYGTRGGEVVLPTVWADCGVILEGVSVPKDGSYPPTPELWKQELDRKGDGLDLEGLTLWLMSGKTPLSGVELPPPGGPVYRFGHGLKQDGIHISVDSVSDFKGDNTLPMTAAGVQTSVGNIEALLETI